MKASREHVARFKRSRRRKRSGSNWRSGSIKEKQFNRKVELNAALRSLSHELETSETILNGSALWKNSKCIRRTYRREHRETRCAVPELRHRGRDEKGKLTKAIDFDQLRQELSDHIVDGPRERYHLDWPGKREALLAANAPIAKTLRPCREESVNFDTTKNLFIEGDNLDALKLLQETYLGKVKMIYIDPPYNTGNDFIYRRRLCVKSSRHT